MINKDFNLYVDMDGVMARWKEVKSLEETFEADFFKNLDPEEVVLEMLSLLHFKGVRIIVLTAVYTNCEAPDAKRYWLKQNNVCCDEVIMVPYGERKKDYIKTSGLNILLDDYSKNLHEWEDLSDPSCKFIGIKFLNGINGNYRTWKGYSVDCRQSAEKMAKTILGIAAVES